MVKWLLATPPKIGSKWCFYDEIRSPWTEPTCFVVEIKNGWVRYKFSESSTKLYFLPIRKFRFVYRELKDV